MIERLFNLSGPTRSNAMGPVESERARRDFLALASAVRRDFPFGPAMPIDPATAPPIVRRVAEVDRLAGEVARALSYADAVDAAGLRQQGHAERLAREVARMLSYSDAVDAAELRRREPRLR